MVTIASMLSAHVFKGCSSKAFSKTEPIFLLCFLCFNHQHQKTPKQNPINFPVSSLSSPHHLSQTSFYLGLFFKWSLLIHSVISFQWNIFSAMHLFTYHMHAEEDTAMSWRYCTIREIILVCRPELSPFNEYLLFSTDWSTKRSWLSTVYGFTRELGEDFHMVFHGSEILIKCIYIYFWIMQ